MSYDPNGVKTNGDKPDLPPPNMNFEADRFEIYVRTPAGDFPIAWPLRTVADWGAQITHEWMARVAAMGGRAPVPEKPQHAQSKIIVPDFQPPRDLRRLK